MADKLIDIVKNAKAVKDRHRGVIAGFGIDRHSHKERERDGRIDNELEQTSRYWLTTGTQNPQHHPQDTNIIIYRNAPIAQRIMETEVGGDFQMRIKGQLNDVGWFFRIKGHILNKINLDDRFIQLENEATPYIYDTLEKYLEHLQEIENDLQELEEKKRLAREEKQRLADEAERKKIDREIARIEKKQKEKQQYREKINNLTRYIHNQVQLRFKPILDPTQTNIKNAHLFDGTAVIIDGGPGTGKTTTMISRLKYLTDTVAIGLDAEQGYNKFKLSPPQRRELEELIRTDQDWVFFSPSELLKLYLQDAMVSEKLNKPNAKVFHWSDRLGRLMVEYGFFDPSSETPPFLKARPSSQLIANNACAIDQLEQFFVTTFHNIYKNLPDIKEIRADWKNTAISIARRLEGVDKLNLQGLIDLFVSINSTYSEECVPYLEERSSLRETTTTRIAALININDKAKQAILDLMTNVQESETEEPDDTEDIDSGEEIETTEDAIDDEERILRYVSRWIEPYARSLYNNHKLSPRQQSFTDIVTPLLKDEYQFERIASLYIFRQYAKYARGVQRIILSGIAGKYKRFRRVVLRDKMEGWDLEQMHLLVEKGDNKRLHEQEQALLIGFVNHLAVAILKRSPNTQHRYISCYKANCRPIIGIDETTDFSLIDIYAMCSFAHKDFSAITLSGDLMQRLTESGIRRWEDLQSIIPIQEVIPLKVSYRQSVKMLEVARQLYRDTIGQEAIYKAHMRETKVPLPIALIETDEQAKITWIEQRIREIYTAYGKTLPSIAIFLNGKDRVSAFAQALQDTDFFYDNGINVIDGSLGTTLGNRNQVRVFPIDKVKGMEFDAVFFVDINNAKGNEEIIKRYLYVGVSRAAFFLGVTLTEDVLTLTKYFKKGEDWKEISKTGN